MKRFLDLTVCIFALIAFAIPMALIAFAVKLTSKGSVLYWSDRVGRGNRIFRMAKFRSMRTQVPQVATHLLENPESYLTPIGGFLRRTSLDELPQLISVLGGDLSLVGPRPALFNQDDLVGLRTEYGIAPRETLTGTVSPTETAVTAAISSFPERTGLPLNSVMTSYGLIPALSAGSPG